MTSSAAVAADRDPARAFRRGLAVRYRPRRFAELCGQRHVAVVLGRLIAAGAAPQQLLLTGGSGLGKTTVGRIAAAALLCDTPLERRDNADACGVCAACTDITGPVPRHPDVIELDAASHGGKDEIRTLVTRSTLAPARADDKVFIIDEVHAITGPGGQAFLKLLEEPPPHVTFILCTTNPEKLSTRAGGAGTLRGRCTEFELVRPTAEELAANLQRIADAEQIDLPDGLAPLLVTATAGELGVRGTVMQLEKTVPLLAAGADLSEIAATVGLLDDDQFAKVTTAVAAGDRSSALAACDQLRRRVADRQLRDRLLAWARDRLRVAAAAGDDVAVTLAADQVEAAAAAPAGEAYTDLAVARMARPDLLVDRDVATVDALIGQARQVLDELHTATAEAQRARTGLAAPEPARTATGTGPAPVAVRGATGDAAELFPAFPDAVEQAPAPDVDATADVALPDEPFPDVPLPDLPSGDIPPPAGRPRPDERGAAAAAVAGPSLAAATSRPAGRGSSRRQRLLDQVAAADPDAAGRLAAADIKFRSNRTVITPTTTVDATALRNPRTFAVVTTAARKIGAGRTVIDDPTS